MVSGASSKGCRMKSRPRRFPIGFMGLGKLRQTFVGFDLAIDANMDGL